MRGPSDPESPPHPNPLPHQNGGEGTGEFGLPSELAHVAIGRLDISRLPNLHAAAEAFLADAEQDEWNRLGHPGRRAEWLAARICLKMMIGEHCAVADPRTIAIEKDARGRPRLVCDCDQSAIVGDCSLAHAGPWAVAAWTQRPQIRLGVDIERISPRLQRVAGAFVSPRDAAAISRPYTEQLAICWCLKEACSKACGLGLGAGLAEIVCTETVASRHTLRRDTDTAMQGWHCRFEDYILAVCISSQAL